MEDETTVRLLPPLRCAWTPRAQQTAVPISGANDQRALFGVVNLLTGCRSLRSAPCTNQVEFQAFLWQLRRSYQGRRIYLLLDKASYHTAERSRALAQKLHIELIWLPRQHPKLNGMDHVWKELKKSMANYQFRSIDATANAALLWVMTRTNHDALRKAGVYSQNYWLKDTAIPQSRQKSVGLTV
jgi:transposase